MALGNGPDTGELIPKSAAFSRIEAPACPARLNQPGRGQRSGHRPIAVGAENPAIRGFTRKELRGDGATRTWKTRLVNVRLAAMLLVVSTARSVANAAEPRRIYLANDDHTDYVWSADAETYNGTFVDMLDYYLRLADETVTHAAPGRASKKWTVKRASLFSCF